MSRRTGAPAVWVALALVVTACAGADFSHPSGAATRPATGAVKRITAAMLREPDLGPGLPIAGVPPFRQLLRGGLTIADDRGARRPQLAEPVPSPENGLWRTLPDGRMETTWKLRPNVQWHDGVPFSVEDVLFTATVLRDRRVPDFRAEAYDWIEAVDAPDASTVVVRWDRPFIAADTLFSHELMPPFPRHVLEPTYRDDPSSLAQLPFWSEQYVGTGPYRVREWVRGSHVVLEANERYVLGRPKIDLIEVRFVPDSNTRLANVLAGTVDLTLGVGFSIEEAIQARDQWREGRVAIEFLGNWVALFPQLINPRPAVVAEAPFRKALMQALDRQEMADTLQGGLVPVAHSFLSPGQPQYREIEARLPRYEYDPRRAVPLLEGLGYHRGPDGGIRDPAGQSLAVPVRGNASLDILSKTTLAVADSWQRLGLVVSTEIAPAQRLDDVEYRATFPAFFVAPAPIDLRGLPDLHSSRAPVPDNNFRVAGGDNRSRYMNPEFDTLLNRYFATIPERERVGVLGEIIFHVADQLNAMGLFYTATPEMIGNRLVNITTNRGPGSFLAWNAHEWDLRP